MDLHGHVSYLVTGNVAYEMVYHAGDAWSHLAYTAPTYADPDCGRIVTLYYAGFALASQLHDPDAAVHDVLEVSPHLDSCCYQSLQLADVCHLQIVNLEVSPCPSLCASLPFWLPSLPVPYTAYQPAFTCTAQDMHIGNFTVCSLRAVAS